jgi:hypothetical protein
MVQHIPIAKAELAGFYLETLFYGVFLVLFAGTVYALYSKYFDHKRGLINKPLWTTTFTLFVFISMHFVLDTLRIFEAFFKVENSAEYFGNIASWMNVTKTMMFVATVWTGDIFITYRVYHVWSRSWKSIIFPLFLLIGTIITGIGIIIQFATFVPGKQDIFNSDCGRWIAGCFSFSLATNTVCAALISYRIWKSDRLTSALIGSSGGRSRLMPAIVVVVESAVIIVIWELSTLVLYLLKSNAQFITLNASSPIIGISFMLIIVRVSMGLGYKDTNALDISTIRFTMGRHPRGAVSLGGEAAAQTFGGTPIQRSPSQIHAHTHAHTHVHSNERYGYGRQTGAPDRVRDGDGDRERGVVLETIFDDATSSRTEDRNSKHMGYAF